MQLKTNKIKKKELYQHETKQHILLKFSIVVITIFVYFFLMSRKYGVSHGFLVTFLTWSFFVLGTPIADAGFLIDFPLRIFLHIKMLYAELLVWCIAIGINIYTLNFSLETYSTTELLTFFKKILLHPFPFWGIFLLSALGTFLSVYFGDELLDKVKHKERVFYHKHKYNYRYILILFIFVISLLLYTFLIKKLGIEALFN